MNTQAIEKALRNMYVDIENATSFEQRNGIFADYAERIASMESDELVSMTEAAELIGVSRQRVHQLLQAGKLDGYKVGNTWSIYRYSVESWLS